MTRKKRTPEERAELEAQLAEWAEQPREFGEVVARYEARVVEWRERRERRRRLLRRLLPFCSASR